MENTMERYAEFFGGEFVESMGTTRTESERIASGKLFKTGTAKKAESKHFAGYAEISETFGTALASDFQNMDIYPLVQWACNYASYAFESDRMNPDIFRKWDAENRIDIESECYMSFVKFYDGGFTFRDGTTFAEMGIIPAFVMSAKRAYRLTWEREFRRVHKGVTVQTCPLSESLHDAYTASEIDRIEWECGLHHAILSVESAKVREKLLGIEKWIAQGLSSYEIACAMGVTHQNVQYWLKVLARKYCAGI